QSGWLETISISGVRNDSYRSIANVIVGPQFSLHPARHREKKGRPSGRALPIDIAFRPGRDAQIETPSHFPGNRDILRSRLVIEKNAFCGLDILNRDDV